MMGMDRLTGAPLDGNDHLAQSVGDILSTPLGTRVMRRDYGSMLADLVDAPANAMTRQLIFAATAAALARWEPRIKLTRVNVSTDNSGGDVVIDIDADRRDLADPNARVRLSIPIRSGGARLPQAA